MKNKQPTAILTADIHLHSDVPICRTDDFLDTQERKIDWLTDLQMKYQCPILDSGDVFHKWKPPPWLLTMAIQHFPLDFHTIAGNHDLPGHNIELFEKSGLSVLEAANIVSALKTPFKLGSITVHPFPWGSTLEPLTERSSKAKHVAIAHTMTWVGKNPWPGCADSDAATLLKKMSGYDLVLTGHNHETFVVKDKQGRLLVNPGSLMRTTADQIDHKPCVFLWYAETNEVEQVFVPIEQNVISREHLVKKEERDERMSSFVEKLNGGYEISSSFEKNMEEFFSANTVRNSVKEIVMNVVHNEN